MTDQGEDFKFLFLSLVCNKRKPMAVNLASQRGKRNNNFNNFLQNALYQEHSRLVNSANLLFLHATYHNWKPMKPGGSPVRVSLLTVTLKGLSQ